MKAPRLPLDRISTLPSSIIENILCLMPIRDAIRTSILSKKWRYNWVNMHKLVFDEDQLYKVSTKTNQLSKNCNLFYTIYQVMLLHRGPVLDFTLSLWESYFEIDQIILHLLRNNTVKKFTLDIRYCGNYKLPSSFFSLKQLTHLNLRKCKLLPPSTFNEFGSLTSLVLDYVNTTKKMLLHFISGCPLKSFTLFESSEDRYLYWDQGDSNIVHLFECLPAIEYLCMNYDAIEAFAKGKVPRVLPTSLAHLKHFDLHDMLMNECDLSYAFLLIRSSPKLEKIKMELYNYDKSLEHMGLFELQDYSDVYLDHLIELEIKGFSNFFNELKFVMLILTKSPILKRVHIEPDCDVSSEEELKMLRILLRLPRVSPLAQITIERP